MKDETRVLVTGCRDWVDNFTVWRALDTVADENQSEDGIQVVVGDCKTGADKFASVWGSRKPEKHYANWDRFGMGAGPKRNTEMVNSGADLCLAFWDGHSRGTHDCIQKAVCAGIPVRIYPRGNGET